MDSDDNITWNDILTHLQWEIATSSILDLFRRSTGELDGDTFIITAPTDHICQRLQHPNLQAVIARAVERVCGQNVTLIVAAADEDDSDDEPDQDQQEPGIAPDSRFSIELISFDPTQRGFVMTSNYAWQYWQPYLAARERQNGARNTGVAFCLWNTLRTFPAAWNESSLLWPSIYTLADMVACGNRHKILGRAEQHNRPPMLGALKLLEIEHIVWARACGEDSEIIYRFRILDNLPLLTPSQVAILSERLQERHAREIERCKLDYDEWVQLPMSSLLPEGEYHEGGMHRA